MSIPYKRRYLRLKAMIDLALKSFMVGAIIGTWIYMLWIGPTEIEAKLISPLAPSVSLGNFTSTGQETEGEKPTYKQFKEYVRQIFGKEANIALAVSQCECSTNRKEWPYCVNSWGSNGRGEHSVGAFQINLAKEAGKGAWVHASKIPGDTIGKKEIWLLDYRQNVMMAKIIRENSGWEAWTGYTSSCWKTKI